MIRAFQPNAAPQVARSRTGRSGVAVVLIVAALASLSAARPTEVVAQCPTRTVSTALQLRTAVATSCVTTILLNPGTYNLALSGIGPLAINQNKTLRGLGTGRAIITASGLSRVMTLAQNITVVLEELTVTGGQALNADGGGIYSEADLTVRNSTISGNAGRNGGGIFMRRGSLLMENVTVSGNTASRDGGGLDIREPAQLVHVTVASNRADEGGGLRSRDKEVELINSIVADNTSVSGGQIRDEINSIGINLVEGGCEGCRGVDLTADPLLLPLASNGGNSFTHALDGPSIARDTAAAAFTLPVDQRGVSRPAAWGYDIGSYEAPQAPYGVKVGPDGLPTPIQRGPGTGYRQDFVVHGRSVSAQTISLLASAAPLGSSFLTLDSLSGPGVTGAGPAGTVNVAAGSTVTVSAWFTVGNAPLGTVDTLWFNGRVAADPRYSDDGWVAVEWVCSPTVWVSTTAGLRAAVADPCVSEILLSPGTYDLTASGSGELVIDQDKTLRNAGGGQVIIDARGASRAIAVDRNITVVLDGLTITGGSTNQDGGGIYTEADLTVRNTTIYRNFSDGDGGGVFMRRGSLLMQNVTVSGNTANGDGGGMDVREPAQLVHVTIAGNSGDRGGGLRSRDQEVELVNSIVADNAFNQDGQIRDEITSIGVNLVEGGCTGCLPGDLTGDPNLSPLGMNGGTSRTQALGDPSIARDAASAAFGLATDQRGIGRPQGAGIDIGAYEAIPAVTASVAALVAAVNRLPSNGTLYQESFTVTNTGPGTSAYVLEATSTASAAVVDSIRGPGLTYGAAPDSALTATLASGGGNVTVQVFYTVPDTTAGTVDPLALLATSAADPSVSATDSTDVTVVRPFLGMTKLAMMAGDTVPGAAITYQLTVTNLGSEAAVQVVVLDSIPPEVEFLVGSASETLPPAVSTTLEYDDGTSAWTYTPVPGACGAGPGYDRCVRYVRWSLDAPLPAVSPDNAAVFSFVAGIQ